MASVSSLGITRDRFVHCSFCPELVRDPNLSPCPRHRYCRKCQPPISEGDSDPLQCPLCQEECDVTTDRTGRLGADFPKRDVTEFHQLQTAHQQGNIRNCHGCTTQLNGTAYYCYKCNHFLCEQCHQIHLSSDHRRYLVKLNDTDMRSAHPKKVSSVTERPRCSAHSNYPADLSCATCSNHPICVVCIYGKHKGHDINNVHVLVESARKRLREILSELEKYQARLHDLPKRVEDVRKRLKAGAEKQLRKATMEYERVCGEETKNVEKRRNILEKYGKGWRNEARRRRGEDWSYRGKEGGSNAALNGKFSAGSFEETEHGNDIERNGCYDKISKCLWANLDRFSRELKIFEGEIATIQQRNEDKLQEIAKHAEHTIQRYKKFQVTSTTVLGSSDEKTSPTNLPDVVAAGESLLEKVQKVFQELAVLADTRIEDLSFRMVDVVVIGEDVESVVEIKGIKRRGWEVNDITTIAGGNMIITGYAAGKSYIMEIDREGEVVRHKQIEKVSGSHYAPMRYCESLTQSLVATACHSSQVGVYEAQSGKYARRDLKDTNVKWSGEYITCIATDTVKGRIYIGGNSPVVLVFDEKLNHKRDLTMPEAIRYPIDMTMHGDDLIICDLGSKNAYAVTTQGTHASNELPKPKLGGYDWYPNSVCTDDNAFIYILWARPGRVLAQYSRDGRQILVTRAVASDAWRLTTLRTGDEEKILIVAMTSSRLYTYALNQS